MMTVMGQRQGIVALLLGGALAVTTACGGSTPVGTSAPGAGASPSPAGAATASSGPNKVNIDAIFPAGRGRDLVLNNCQTCHTFVPIVVLQMDQNAWQRNGLDHRQRVPGVSDEDFKLLYEYLSSNFNPSRPVPTLPKELLESWTSY